MQKSYFYYKYCDLQILSNVLIVYFFHLVLTEQPNEHFYLILSDAIHYLPVISYQFHYHLSYVQPYVSLKSQKNEI